MLKPVLKIFFFWFIKVLHLYKSLFRYACYPVKWLSYFPTFLIGPVPTWSNWDLTTVPFNKRTLNYKKKKLYYLIIKLNKNIEAYRLLIKLERFSFFKCLFKYFFKYNYDKKDIFCFYLYLLVLDFYILSCIVKKNFFLTLVEIHYY